MMIRLEHLVLKRLFAVSLAVIAAACASSTAPPVNAVARLDHVAINVPDARASAEFYRAAFGLSELKAPFAGGGVVWLDLGNGVALHVFGGRSGPVADERERHIAFSVADMSKVTGFLKSRGIPWQNFDGLSGEVQTRPDGVRQMFFRAPDGYWIEVNDALKLSTRF